MNNNNNNGKKLISHLEQEISWIESLNSLLADEKIVLATRQFDQLEELAEKKQELSVNLENSAKGRMELMSGSYSEESPGLLLKEFLKSCSSAESVKIDKLNNKLVEQLTICRELNTVNGQVIANNIHTRQQLVDMLTGNTNDHVSVYTSTGNMKAASENNHHQEA